MEILYRLVSGLVAALAALVCPIVPLILSAVAFIFVDFLTGVAASYVEPVLITDPLGTVTYAE